MSKEIHNLSCDFSNLSLIPTRLTRSQSRLQPQKNVIDNSQILESKENVKTGNSKKNVEKSKKSLSLKVEKINDKNEMNKKNLSELDMKKESVQVSHKSIKKDLKINDKNENNKENLSELDIKKESVEVSHKSIKKNLKINDKNENNKENLSELDTKKESIKKELIKEEKIIKSEKLIKSKNITDMNNERMNVANYESEILVCREKEKSEISTFLEGHFSAKTNGSLYVSGTPGTGKTALVTTLLSSMERAKKCSYHVVTCMDFNNPMNVFTDLWTKLSNQEVSNTNRAMKEIENYLIKRSMKEVPLVIVLDEVDILALTNQRILYKIFKWVELAKCQLIVIGIANSLDLTESKLTEILLESYCPYHIHFPPYNEEELTAIIMSRVTTKLTRAEELGVSLCSKKISGKSGDARLALSLYKRAAVFSEDDQLSDIRLSSAVLSCDLSPNSTPVKKVFNTPTLLSMKRSQFLTPSSPSIKHVNRAIKEVEKATNPYKNIVNAETGESTLPLHHKLVLCSALVLSKQKKDKCILGQLYDTYMKVCSHQQLSALGMSELVEICDLLDARALLRVRYHKEIRQRTFILNLDENGIRSALSDNSLLTTLMAKFCV